MADLTPLAEWVRNNAGTHAREIDIPDERPARLDSRGMFDQETVYFGRKRESHIICPSRGAAELIERMASLGVAGTVAVPTDNSAGMKLLDKLNHCHERGMARLRELVQSRTTDVEQQSQVLNLLERWFVQGKPSANQT